MKHLNLFSTICIICCFILLNCLFIKINPNEHKQVYAINAEGEEDDTINKVDNYLLDACNKAGFPALSVTIVNKDSVLFSKSYGNCDNTEVPFLLGSVSKSFTALCIMQLQEQGKLNIDNTISNYIINATQGDKITIRQLLNHTSGLGEHQNLTNYKIIGKQGIHKYANVNYSLLGKIIENVSGISYEEYVTKNIFEPLNMIKSAATYEQAKLNGLIQGYENWFGFNIKTNCKFPNNTNSWITTQAGYLSSSTFDLGKYLQMYINGGKNIISKESINKMFYEGVKVDANIPYEYGMGWTLINEPLKEPALRHAGLVETGMSTIYILPESEIGVAIAVNSNDYFVGKDLMDRIDWGVTLMLLGEQPNLITENEFVLKHIVYDLIYLVFLIISILPFCLLSIFKKFLLKNKLGIIITFAILLHLVLPVLILLIPKMFFATPLWVVCAFVPDMFLTIIVSSTLLFIGGVIKVTLIFKKILKNKKL